MAEVFEKFGDDASEAAASSSSLVQVSEVPKTGTIEYRHSFPGICTVSQQTGMVRIPYPQGCEVSYPI